VTKAEKRRLTALLRATEYLFLENLALKLILEHREIKNWQKLLDHLLADKDLFAGVNLQFRDLYTELEHSKDPSQALDSFLTHLPRPTKN
jgi:hypothetical protein